MIQWNNKDVWGIVRYNGESNSAFTHGRCYYVPIGEANRELVPDSGIIDDEEWTSYRAWNFGRKTINTTDTEAGFVVNERIEFSGPRFELLLDPSGELKQFFPGNEEKIFIVFILHSEKSTLIGISEDIPKDWHGKKVLIDGMEFETTPVYDLPNHIAIIGSGGDLGQEIIFV